ncbi:MAG TPA: isoprenylcysteine carboxylmethyltransferase family protein [Candidatus Binatia bacterium]|nr:isoprenylcysteine carboxylmethyltransferase family protein [Candidatus Binatia bacterium]
MAKRRPDGWFVAGFVGLLGFFALEATTRGRGAASSLTTTKADESTTRGIVLAYVGSGIGASVAALVPGPRLPAVLAPCGLAVQAAGIALRAWSMRTLGNAYTRTLRTGAGQEIVDSGPYRAVRHPGYLGSLITWLGFALTSRSPAVVALCGAILGRAYSRRITAEERLLRRDLPGYEAYSARTRRLIPLVW